MAAKEVKFSVDARDGMPKYDRNYRRRPRLNEALCRSIEFDGIGHMPHTGLPTRQGWASVRP
jgi:hypothetical protein